MLDCDDMKDQEKFRAVRGRLKLIPLRMPDVLPLCSVTVHRQSL